MSAHLTEAPRPAVAGFVDAITETVARGWAWIPGQSAPVPVELRLGEEVVSEAIADGMRTDLAQLGIGEGRHAFSLPVPEALRPRLSELHVVARTPDGATNPLSTPPAEDDPAERLAKLSRGMDILIGSQRVLHRNVQAALLAGPQAAPSAPVDFATTQAALQDGIATLELFVTRLELGMAGLAAHQPRPAQSRWALGVVAAVAATAVVLSAWALILALPG